MSQMLGCCCWWDDENDDDGGDDVGDCADGKKK